MHARRFSALAVVLATALAPAITALPATASPPGHPVLADLILDQIGRLDQPFTAGKLSYSATAYRSLNQLGVYAVPASADEQVSVNGQAPAADAKGRVTVPLKVGNNPITITVTQAGHSTDYTLKVHKVDTDYRGRVQVPGVTASSPVGSSDGHPVTALVDGDDATTWAPPSPFHAGSPDTTGVEQFTLDLNQERWVGRLTAKILTYNDTWFPDNSHVQIDVSKDGNTWTTAADHAPLRADQGLIYWDFNRFYQGRYVRITLTQAEPKLLTWLEWRGVDVFALPQGATPPPNEAGPVKPGTPTSAAYVPNGADGVNRAQELAIENNIGWGAWTPAQGAAAGTPNAAEYNSLGRPFAQFYDPPLANSEFMSNNPNATWGLAKAPFANNGIGTAGTPRDFIPTSMKPYAANFVDAQFGDEGGYSTSEVDAFKQWFDYSKTNYPQAAVHANQNNGGAWTDIANMEHYVRTAQPDLLTFDDYYWGGGGVFGSFGPQPWQATSSLLSTRIWQTQRQAALEGLTGDGSQPIQFGQYLDGFDFNASQSQRALVTGLSLASGMKWLNLFRLECNRYDGGAMVDQDGAPLREWYEYADLMNTVKNFGTYLTPLTNQWLATEPGSHLQDGQTTTNPVSTGWHMDTFVKSGAANASYGVAGVHAKNIGGTVNNGLPGDVTLGYFAPTPGVKGDILKQRFGNTDPRAFTVVNGLSGQTQLPSTKQGTRYDNGQFWQTEQSITLDLVPPTHSSKLMQVDPSTGKPHPVPLSRSASGATQATITLGGGQTALMYWNDPPLEVNATLSESTVPTGSTTQATVTLRNSGDRVAKNISLHADAVADWSEVGPADATFAQIMPGETKTVNFSYRNVDGVGGASLTVTVTENGRAIPIALDVQGTCSAPKLNVTGVAADSQETVGENAPLANAFDGNPATFWHTQWKDVQPGYPHWVVMDAHQSGALCSLNYLSRQDAVVGRVKDYQVFVSDDPNDFPATPAAEGSLADVSSWQAIGLHGAKGRYVKFIGKDAWDGKAFMVAAELGLQ